MSTIAEEKSPRNINDFDFPDGWTAVKLPEICDLNPPKPKVDALTADSPVTFVPMPAVDAELGAITSPDIRPFSTVRKGFTAFREGDVIFAKITPCMENGKAAIAKALKNGLGFGSTEFHVLRPSDAVMPEFIYYFVRQESYRRAAEAEMTGSVGQKRVPVDFLENTELPLPPLAEQKRIVAKIEDLLTRARKARESLSNTTLALKRFHQSVLDAACTGRLTEDWRREHINVENARYIVETIKRSHEALGHGHGGKAAEPTEDVHTLSEADFPDTWTVFELMWLCEPGSPITYGILKPGPNLQNGIPYIRVADFPNDRLNVSGIRRTSETIAHEYRRSTLRSDDLLLSIRGTVGRVCRVPETLNGANITQDTARIAVHRVVSRDYIEAYLRSPDVQRRLQHAMKGVAVRGVNIGDVRALQIALPPLEEQREIVRRVDFFFKLADSIKTRTANATKLNDKMTQAILAKGFRGELVPTEAELARREGREFEPASALLERIRTESERNVTRATTRRSSRNGRSAQR